MACTGLVTGYMMDYVSLHWSLSKAEYAGHMITGMNEVAVGVLTGIESSKVPVPVSPIPRYQCFSCR